IESRESLEKAAAELPHSNPLVRNIMRDSVDRSVGHTLAAARNPISVEVGRTQQSKFLTKRFWEVPETPVA
ncbi:MAG: hypothetical protein WA789_15160, partial [Candidatus Acidiferrum sp.]